MFQLSEREKIILRDVIHQFIITASPVGSRNLSKKSNLNLSAATIRNIMSDLEENGLLKHPHTSAGRVPTDNGYRFYVDSLMVPVNLDDVQKNLIANVLVNNSEETNDILKLTASVLSKITNQLACVTYPNLRQAKLEKIRILSLSTNRILVVVAVQSGLVKTITLELNAEINEKKLSSVEQILNEKLSGLDFSEIRKTFAERLKNYEPEYTPVIRVFLDSIDKVFTDEKGIEKIYVAGIKNIVKQPEFEDHTQFQSVIELIEDEDVIIHFLETKNFEDKDVYISIGKENQNKLFTKYSLIAKKYNISNINGTIGIIGPKRMQYNKSIAAIIYIADLLSKELKK